VFEWDRHNLSKIKRHRIDPVEVEQALSNDPILVYEQDADQEPRYVYYGETAALRLLAIVLTEREEKIRVITAYDLDAGQKRDYLERRTQEE
jgi:uncharacterized DUF497 family protein